MKKLLLTALASTLLLSVNFAYADTDDDAAKIFPKTADNEDTQVAPEAIASYIAHAPLPTVQSGTYLGVQAFLMRGSFSRKTSNAVNTDVTFNSGSKIGGSLFGGIDDVIGNWYMAGELAGVIGNWKADNNFTSSSNSKVSYKMLYTVNLDFKPGYIINQHILLFLTLGATGGFLQGKPSVDAAIAGTNGFWRILYGPRVGGGIDYYFTDKFSVRLDYAYNYYLNAKYTYTDTVGAKTYSNKFGATNNQFGLGFLYHF